MSSKNQPHEVKARSAQRSSSSSSRAPTSGTGDGSALLLALCRSRAAHGSPKQAAPSRSNSACSSPASQSTASRSGALQRCCDGFSAASLQPQSARHRSTPCGQLHELGATSVTSVAGGLRARNAAKFSTRAPGRAPRSSSSAASAISAKRWWCP
ncbi:MAG: hypothetical protein A3I79_02580 [Gemmatimonadetes bacterium RIFCSPLOWO2_02_FULL_71_11]|nr:MAG: hypothetical protein A3I79_02580 [Gemmatimonadetes bacterium RIFCSPLOWO2_02_FULL_71_11]